MWWIEALAAAYLGLSALASANHRFHALPLAGGRIARPGTGRLVGTGLLALAAWLACHAQGVAHGIVALACLMSVAGVPLVLLLSVRPALALAPVSPLLLPGSTRRSPHHH